jgi:transcriptional regulator with XRE-family HTH domain
MKNNIKEFRNARGMSQRDLAKAVGTSQQQIQRIENSKQAIKIHMAAKICKALGCELSDAFPASKGHEKKLKKLLPINEFPNPDKILAAERETGIDADPLNWTLMLLLRGGSKHYFPVSAGTIRRLRKVINRRPLEFFCFDSENLEVAVNLKHVIHFHTLWDPDKADIEPKQVRHPINHLCVTLANAQQPLIFKIEPDDTYDNDFDSIEGQFSDLMNRLDVDPNCSEFLEFEDDDGENAFFRVDDVAMITLLQDLNFAEI